MKYEITIEERFVRTVLIEADGPSEAVEAAEELCNSGLIDLNTKDFNSRNCYCEGSAPNGQNGLETFIDPCLADLEAEAKEAIDQFCRTEYNEPADFTDIAKIPLLYTDYDENSDFHYKVEVFASLPERSISTYVNGIMVSCIKQKSLADYVDMLEYLDFDAYAKISEDEWKVFNEYVGLAGLPEEKGMWLYDIPSEKRIVGVYYNPDAVSGGQFVQIYIPYWAISVANKNTNGVGEFSAHIYSIADTELIDITTPEFAKAAAEYRKNKPTYIAQNDVDMMLWLSGRV